MKVSARILADDTRQVLTSIVHRRDLSLEMRETELELGVRRPDAARLAWANEVLANPNGKQPLREPNVLIAGAINDHLPWSLKCFETILFGSSVSSPFVHLLQSCK